MSELSGCGSCGPSCGCAPCRDRHGGGLGSYYESNYYSSYGPYYIGGDKTEPVPGWGMMPVIAGPERVGIGQEIAVAQQVGPIKKIPAQLRPAYELEATSQIRPKTGSGGGLPWWGWGAIGGALGVGVAIAKKRGMLPWP